MNLKFFIDFDGTITQQDVIDAILERFADPQWRMIEREWADGRIGSRECLSRQMGLVKATKAEFRKLVGEIKVDPAFYDFLKTAKRLSVPVIIASDGMDWVIREILKEDLPVFSNKLEWTPEGVRIGFPEGPLCVHSCANCKARVITSQRLPGETVVFVGDGLSDRFATGHADVVFAKNKLLKFCEENKIKHEPYVNFENIEKWLLARHSHRLGSLPKGSYATV